MAAKEKIFVEIAAAFCDFDEELLREKINLALEHEIDAPSIIKHLSKILEGIGDRFCQGEIYLPELVISGDLMEMAVGILEPMLLSHQEYAPVKHKIILGTVKGDIHTIGKDMVKMMWTVSGFDVIDLGIDVPAELFFCKAQEINPSIVALSSTMTTTIPNMKDTIDLFKSRGLDQKYKILIGGGSVNPDLAKQLGAPYGGRDAYEAVKSVKAILAGG